MDESKKMEISHSGKMRRPAWRRGRDRGTELGWSSMDPFESLVSRAFRDFWGDMRAETESSWNLDRFFSFPEGTTSFDWAPRVDVSETSDAIKVYAELPGLTKDSIKLEIKDNVLYIRGERKFEEKEDKGDYKRIERSYGSFLRGVPLPEGTDHQNIKAKYDAGVLEVEIRKPETAKSESKTIDIE